MLSVMMYRSEKKAASDWSSLGRWNAGGVVGLASSPPVLWRSFGSGLKAATCWVVQTARVWKPGAAFPSVATELPEELVFWAQNVLLTDEFVEAGQVLLKRRALTAALAPR